MSTPLVEDSFKLLNSHTHPLSGCVCLFIQKSNGQFQLTVFQIEVMISLIKLILASCSSLLSEVTENSLYIRPCSYNFTEIISLFYFPMNLPFTEERLLYMEISRETLPEDP